MMRLTPLRPGCSALTTALQSLTLTTTSSTSAARSPAAAARAAFSTTPAARTKTIFLEKIPSDPVPPYPYGPRLLYKQSNKGLYGAARIRHGHNVSERHGQVTPRTWKPNTHRKRLWSEALACWVRAKLTTRVLRTLRREGGIDAYVTKDKAARIKDLGPGGWRLRWLVMQSAHYRAKYAAEREKLGLTADMPPDNTDLAHVLVDGATRGRLSLANREVLAQRAAAMLAEEIAIGDEAEFGEDVVDEAEFEGEEEAPEFITTTARDITKKRR